MAIKKTPSTTSPTTVFPANTARAKGGLIFDNSDPNTCYVLIGDSAIDGAVSTTNYSFRLKQDDTANIVADCGAVYCIWGTAGTGQLVVTEYIN